MKESKMCMFIGFVILLSTHVSLAEDSCVEGFVMDRYCIDLGVLLDNRAVKTLEEPEKHSVHCLVDVSICYNSGFNILLPNPSGNPKYAYAITLDKAGTDMALILGRKHGTSCSTCTGEGNIKQGFRATFIGEIAENPSGPAIMKVKNVTLSPRVYNASAADGCPAGMPKPDLKLFTQSGSFEIPSIAHGTLMIIGWGLLLPTGVSAAHFLKHRPNALWFKLHRIIQVCGLIVALCGWITALATFDVFGSPGTNSFNHGCMGMTVMILGLLQPINAFIRPHPPEEGKEKPFKRLLWEIIHKCSGYIAIILAAATICYGTFVIFGYNTEFRAAWIVTLVWVIGFSGGAAYDGYRHSRVSATLNDKTVAYSKN